MLRTILTIVPLAIMLSSCSYVYDLHAVVSNEQLMFIVSPASSQQPECLRDIEVVEESGGRETLWSESVSYDDDCANEFPVVYGVALKGQHLTDRKEVSGKPLQRGVIYNVSATTGATGYGGGRFLIDADGRVKNLPWPSDDIQEDTSQQ